MDDIDFSGFVTSEVEVTGPTGKKSKVTRVCVTVINNTNVQERRKVTFYRELIPAGGAMPSKPSNPAVLCTTKEEVIPAAKPGGTPGGRVLCCDMDELLGGRDQAFGQENFVVVAGKEDPQKKNAPIPLDKGAEQKSFPTKDKPGTKKSN